MPESPAKLKQAIADRDPSPPPNKKLRLNSDTSSCFKQNSESIAQNLTDSIQKQESTNARCFHRKLSNLSDESKQVMPSFLYIVNSCKVNNNSYECTIEIEAKSLNSGAIKTCTLQDSWSSTNICEKDIVHILAEPESDGNFLINDTKGLLIVNPHYILSGTTVLSGMFCMRKSALNYKYKDTEAGTSSQHMVLGSLLHVLFQAAIANKKYTKSELNQLLLDLLKKKQIISQLYDANLNEEHVLRETSVYLESIEKWLKENLSLNKSAGKNFQINDIYDIEESIWSPKYGVKGKLDLTVKTSMKLNAFKNLAANSSSIRNSFRKESGATNTHGAHSSAAQSSHVIPVELKSGKTTFSVEHEGQVQLYSLLNYEKRQHSDFGLLLYLKDMNMKFIRVNQASLRGLIQLRNELTFYIHANKLPDFKSEERICSKCPLLITCSLLGRESAENDLYKNSILHLSESHIKYFFKWHKMLELEFQEQKQFDAGSLVWWRSMQELEKEGWTVGNLRLEKKTFQTFSSEYSGEGFFLFDFKKEDQEEKEEEKTIERTFLKENDMILLSSQSENLVGIAQGFIRSIKSNAHFQLLIDKNLDADAKFKSHLFRIDKINYRSAINLNYTNLARLMSEKLGQSTKLRQFVIDRQTPTFDKVLPKQYIIENRSIFKKLNQSQQAAILKTLMANDYLLIKGYPGTGKTTTIASLIKILVNLGKKILFTSFTNSAVDNLLIKIINEFDIDFVRIGSYERIHVDVQKFESNFLTSNIKSVAELDEFYKSKRLIAATCSSINHVVFSKIEFDYCIIDEASQVLLTTCLGPLFVSKKFILVGDLEQLPPIIKNKEARSMGMGVSLFEWLDNREGSVELVHQYRMNKQIMALANETTYQGKLQCVSEKVATSIIKLDATFLSKIADESMRLVYESPVVFIDTSEIMRPILSKMRENESNDADNRTVNRTECDIVNHLVEIFYKFSDCKSAEHIGIIAPYNNQVKELQTRFSRRSFYKDIEINTVDQFQGRDKRMIIMSFTNSANVNSEQTAAEELEILNDKRRLTVAITRSKEKLLMIGCVENLVRYRPMCKMISILKEKCLIVVPNSIEQLFNI